MSNSAFSQSAAPSSFADLTGVPDDNVALATALAGKAGVTLDGAVKTYLPTTTGLANAGGQLVIDFTAASGARPALSSVQFSGGFAKDATSGGPVLGYPIDETLSAYTVQFYNVLDLAPCAEGTPVAFTVIGTP